jgi:DNA polymerase-1
VAVLFDGACRNPRKELDDGYKANRPDWEEEEETPFDQLPDIYAALDYLGISHRETECCEADDWIAGYALSWENEVVIASFDSDFFQLITDQVHILRYRGENTVICDPAWLMEKYGIAPAQYAAFKALTGDTADNIPGIPGVGPKTAAALLKQFGTLEGLLEGAETICKPSIRAAVTQNRDRLRLNHLLIRLEAGETLPFTKDELAWADPGITTTEVLRAIGLRE